VSKPDPELLTNEQLAAEIEEGMGSLDSDLLTVEEFCRWLEEQGEPTAERVEGTLCMEMFWKFCMNLPLGQAIWELPYKQQEWLARIEFVDVVREIRNKPEVRCVSLFKLTQTDIAILFDGPRMRSISEQMTIIKNRLTAAKPKKARKVHYPETSASMASIELMRHRAVEVMADPMPVMVQPVRHSKHWVDRTADRWRVVGFPASTSFRGGRTQIGRDGCLVSADGLSA
jgi:hypothetical protein